MSRSTRRHLSLAAILIIVIFLAPEASPASGDLLVAYGGHNETMAPMWVGVDRGLFKKHGIDPRVLQTRSGPIMMATMAVLNGLDIDPDKYKLNMRVIVDTGTVTQALTTGKYRCCGGAL